MLKTFELATQKGKLDVNYYKAPEYSNEVTIFVCGSGGTKDEWELTVKALRAKGFSDNMITFTFCGRREGNPGSLENEYDDLYVIISDLLQSNIELNIKIVATSQGAASASRIAGDSPFYWKVKNLLLIDPANYKKSEADSTDPDSWEGDNEFNQESDVSSSYLKNARAKVSVVRLGVRNHLGQDYGYYEKDNKAERAIDNPYLYPRLHQASVEAYFHSAKNTSEEIIVLNSVPHAFNRDGDQDYNIDVLSNIIIEELGSNPEA
jgi:hypothetical protein